MYSYTPKGSSSAASYVCPAAALLCIAAAMLTRNSSYAEYVRICAFAVFLADILLFTRLVLTSFTYTLTDDEGRVDLIVDRRVGRKILTVCRVSVADGRLIADKKHSVPDGTTIYDYRPGLFSARGYVFFPCESEGGGAIRFSPDDVMVSLIYRNGASE